jgi:predicted Zn-dependent protease with MMP-like domain
MVRTGKISPTMFLDMLIYGISDGFKSLEQMCNKLFAEYGVKIEKQSLDERFNSLSTAFVKELLGQFIQNQISHTTVPETTQLFKSVRIKDSTIFDVDESLAKQFPGFGGSEKSCNSKASVSIQYEFDIKNAKVLDFDFLPATQKDSVNAMLKKDTLEKGDLILRDLGYYSGDIIAHYILHEIFFVSKLYHNVSVYLKEKDKDKIDFAKLYKQMINTKQNHLDIQVYIGKKRQPVRLIVLLMPEDIQQNRVDQKNKENKRNGYTTSDEYKARAHFNLYITNIPNENCTWENVTELYRMRWQIELAFKIWKSIMNIDQFLKVKPERILTMLHVKLLWIFMNWNVVSQCRNQFYLEDYKLLSMYKSFQTIKEMSEEIRESILKNTTKLKNTLLKIIQRLKENHWLEKRKKRHNFEEIYPLIFCQSVNCSYI